MQRGLIFGELFFSSGETIHHFNSFIFKEMPGVFNLESPFDINGSHVAEMST